MIYYVVLVLNVLIYSTINNNIVYLATTKFYEQSGNSCCIFCFAERSALMRARLYIIFKCN